MMKLFIGILIAAAIFFASQNNLAHAHEPVTCKDLATEEIRQFEVWCPDGWKYTRKATRTAQAQPSGKHHYSFAQVTEKITSVSVITS